MPELLTMQDLANGHLDVKALGEAANGDENTIVTTRTGNTYPSAERAINTMFKNGGLPATPFPTLAKMQTEGTSLADGQLAMVYNETANNGLYVKTAGVWVKSAYDPVTQARSDTDSAISDFSNTFLDRSNNLFDASAATVGEFVNVEGHLTLHPDHAVSDFIPVEQNKVYTVSASVSPAFNIVLFYDVNGSFISFLSLTSPKVDSFITPVGTTSIRLNIYDALPTDGERMLNKGSVALPYEPYKPLELKVGSLSDNIMAYLSDNLTPNKLDAEHVVRSLNLFKEDDYITGGYISPTGIFTEDVRFSISGFIPVKELSNYSLLSKSINGRLVVDIVYYNVNKSFIGRLSTDSNYEDTKQTFKTPINTAFVVLNFRSPQPVGYNVMLYKGSSLLPYQPHTNPKLVGIDVANAVGGGSKEFAKPNNMFRYNDVEYGGYYNSLDVWTPDTTYSSSNYIAVEPSTQYTLSGDSGFSAFIRTLYYDANKQIISSENTGNKNEPSGYKVITTPENAYYVRLLMNQGTPSQLHRMFNKGSVVLPYDRGFPVLGDADIDKALVNSNNVDVRLGDWIAYTGDRHSSVLLDFPESYSKDDARNISTEGTPVTYADMIGWWQELADEFPDYITKKKIGVDSSGTLDVHSYTFMPKNLTNQGVSNHPKQQRPRVLMIVQHIEQMNQLYPLFAMRELCRKWHTDPLLAALRLEVEFVVIPYAHPYGFSNDYRLTADGLNTNGDWPLNWNHVTNPLNGDAPFATQEARNIKAVVEDFKPHVVFDLHSAGGNASRHGVWIDAEANGKYVNSTYCALTSMYPKLKAKFPDYADIDKLLTVTYNNAARQAPGYMYAVGATGGLIEMMKNRGDRLASDGIYNDTLVFASSMLLNITSECIAEYRDYGRPNKQELYNGDGVYYADLNKP